MIALSKNLVIGRHVDPLLVCDDRQDPSFPLCCGAEVPIGTVGGYV